VHPDPGQDNIPKNLGVQSYPVLERDRLVWIWMGEPALADPAKILDFPYLRDPAWRGRPDYMHYKANYLLIVDNLSDFAHLAFVHTKTLGGSEEYAYKSKPTAIERPRGRLPRRALAHGRRRASVPQEGGAAGREGRPPQHRPHVRAGYFLHGDAVLARRQPARAKGTSRARSSTATASSSPRRRGARRTFFWDYLHDYDLDNPAIAASLRDSMVEGFLEDKFIIEGPAGRCSTPTRISE
jgi:vanillate O-demethylase monooxygenase subunit